MKTKYSIFWGILSFFVLNNRFYILVMAHSAERRKKISDTLKSKGIVPPRWWETDRADEIKEKIRKANTGKKASIETRKKLSKSLLGNKSTLGKTGKFANAWKDGRTTKNKLLRSGKKWVAWRKAVFERDGYTCRNCGARCCEFDGKIYIEPHHRTPVAELIKHNLERYVYDVRNGVTLCQKCHRLTFKGI